MASNERHTQLKRCIDWVARLAFLSPFILLLTLHNLGPTGPLTAKSAIAILSVFALFALSFAWIIVRYAKSPRKTYPLLDLLMDSARARVIAILLFPIAFGVADIAFSKFLPYAGNFNIWLKGNN
jgi:hypothetical protein